MKQLFLALPEAESNQASVCCSPQVCFRLRQRVFVIQRVYNWRNEGCRDDPNTSVLREHEINQWKTGSFWLDSFGLILGPRCQTGVGSFRFQQSFFCNWVRLYGRCIRCATSVSSRGCRAGSSLPNSDKNKTEHLSPSTHTSTLFCPEWKLKRKNKTKHLRKFNYPPFKPFVHVIFLFSWVVPQR